MSDKPRPILSSLAGLQAARRPMPAQPAKVASIARAFTREPEHPGTQALSGAKLAKRNDPSLEATKVFLDSGIKVAAARKYQDACRLDPLKADNVFSDLVQELLERYLEAGNG